MVGPISHSATEPCHIRAFIVARLEPPGSFGHAKHLSGWMVVSVRPATVAGRVAPGTGYGILPGRAGRSVRFVGVWLFDIWLASLVRWNRRAAVGFFVGCGGVTISTFMPDFPGLWVKSADCLRDRQFFWIGFVVCVEVLILSSRDRKSVLLDLGVSGT